MKNRRWGDNDKHLWPFTWSGTRDNHWKPIGCVLDSGAQEGSDTDCYIRFSAFGYHLICELPRVIDHFRIRHKATYWDAATIERMGRDWYDEVFPREFGFHFSEGSLHVYFGPQTHDSLTTKSKTFFLPWKHLRHIRTSLYDAQGKHFFTHIEKYRHNAWSAVHAVKEACPKVQFDFEDYDGEKITATTHIQETEWKWGEGAFKWLSWVRGGKISRDLYLEFSAEVGKEKGSWKGGTVGHSIAMLPGELHEAAFRRYCELDHRCKDGQYRIRFIGPTPPKVLEQATQCAAGKMPQ